MATKKKVLKKGFFFLNGPAFTPLPPFSGPATKDELFFAASLINIIF